MITIIVSATNHAQTNWELWATYEHYGFPPECGTAASMRLREKPIPSPKNLMNVTNPQLLDPPPSHAQTIMDRGTIIAQKAELFILGNQVPSPHICKKEEKF